VEAIQQSQGLCISDYKVSDPEITGDGDTKYWDFTTWPVRDANENLTGTILVASDVTERVLLEEQRKDFIGTLAHDLQTPVIASDRALELLMTRMSKDLEPDLLKLVSGLRQNNQNLLRMIQGLLDVYQYEAGAITLYFDHLDLDQLAVTCVDELTPLAEKYERKIKTEFDGKEHLVWADRTGLRRVVTNLIDNAIKYSHPGGTILVSVSQTKPDNVVLKISNSGAGIAYQDQGKIFERFWHGSGPASYKASSGLGLYLCKQIVAAHKGHIAFQSEPGKTTTFYVQLPTSKTAGVTIEQLESVSSV
jgi:signal transduction histidine kinase